MELNETQLNAEASVNGTLVYNPPEGTILGIGERTLSVDFTPKDFANYTSASKSVSIKVLNASYSIFKSVIAPDENGDCILNSAGDKVPYRIVVKNEGDEKLTNVTVNDSMVTLTGPSGNEIDPEVLNQGETWVFTGVYTLTPDNINNESSNISNAATVSCNELPEKTSNVKMPIAKKTGLSIYKSVIGIDEAGDYMINEPGDVINYQVAVRNKGNVKLTGVSVNDPMVTLTGPTRDHSKSEILNPGETWVYTGNYTVTREDIDSNGNNDGFIENTATVSCNELSNESSSTVLPIIRIPPIVVTPESNGSSALPTVDFNTNTTSGYEATSSSGGSSSEGVHHRPDGYRHAHIIHSSSNYVSSSSDTGTATRLENSPQNPKQNNGNTANHVQNTSTQAKESKETPGFATICGITALLAVYLHKR
jgi:hypothetical protein